jgi:uncharacterized protein YjiS (DUF1127 family)
MATELRSFSVPRPSFGGLDLGRRLQAIRERLAAWEVRHLARRGLTGLPQSALDDIGISQIDAAREAGRPFWRD